MVCDPVGMNEKKQGDYSDLCTILFDNQDPERHTFNRIS